jgi:MFS transporter, DHA3 family, macrolide efflux protein
MMSKVSLIEEADVIPDSRAQSQKGMKTFMVIWLGQILSMLGSGLTNFALSVWIFEQTGRATPFALAALAGSVPRILLSPIAGSIVDRWDRRKIMILADSANALITLAVAVLYFSDSLQVWHIYIIALIGSSFGAFQEPAYTASITMLVPKKDLARASGMTQSGQALEMLISPILAGILFVTIGLRGIILIDFATFFFAIGALLLVRIPRPPVVETEGERKSIWSDAAFGFKYLRARSGLLGLLLFFALTNFLLNLAAVLTGPLVLSFSNAAALGGVQTAGGAGMLAGSIVLSAWGGPTRRIPWVFVVICLAACGLILMGLNPSAFVISLGMFVFLAPIPVGSGLSQALFQSKVEPGVQGRVFAIRGMISRSMMPLAFLLAGPLSDRVFEPLMMAGGALADSQVAQIIGSGAGRGTALIFVSSGIVLLGTSLLAYLNPRIRNLEQELPDVISE